MIDSFLVMEIHNVSIKGTRQINVTDTELNERNYILKRRL